MAQRTTQGGLVVLYYMSRREFKLNYFNTDIINNHDDHLYLNNSMAECYDFCLGLAELFMNKSDMVWYTEQKRGHICYDV